MAANPAFRFFYVAWAFMECLLFGGLLYGWGSLVFILKRDGVYSGLCEVFENQNRTVVESSISTVRPHALNGSNSIVSYNISTSNSTSITHHHELATKKSGCTEQDNRLVLVFTIGSMLFCAGTAVMGQINFKFGTRVTRLCACAILIIGALLTGFTSQDIPWLIFPGLTLLGIGGIPLLMTNMQFSMLFTKGSSTVVSMLSGAFDASSGVMLIVKLVHEKGVELKWSMLVIAGAHLLTLVNSFLFLPRGFISKPAPKVVVEDATVSEAGVELILKKKQSTEVNGTSQPIEEEVTFHPQADNKEPALPPIMSCILSPVYILHVIWLSILQLRFYYFIGSLNTWLNALLGSKEEVSFYTNVALYAMMCGLFTSPLAGMMYDFNKRFFINSRSVLRRNLMPAVIPLAFTSMLGIVLSILVLFHSVDVLYPSFIFNTIFRSFIYSIGAAYIGVMFPSEYFGMLYGTMIILSGVISLAQYGLVSWAEASGYSVVNYFLIAFMATSLVHPLYQWYACRKAEKEGVIKGED
ncbi:hypothetical protein BaRGS_00039376 [Batillaria attramentaria]|uniref:Uncharacterized protein n=1 Tax=Batillaria attramentaria TaxID=370345 RepID=A0ABD0J3E9_9CAEN